MSRRYTVDSACAGRVLNELHREGVSLDCVDRQPRSVRFCVADDRCSQTENCLNRHGHAFRSVGLGARGAVRRLVAHPALWLIALTVVAAVVVCSHVVWSVQIDCIPALRDQVAVVVAPVAPLGQWRTRVDCRALQQKVVALPDVALASVYIQGTRLVIEAKEELPTEGIRTPSFAPIVATCDCIISRVVVERGRALVQEGQSVRKGDVLIAAEYLVDPAADVTLPTEAIGQVYGYVFPSVVTTYCERTQTLVFTGRQTTYAVISVGDTAFGALPDSPYPTAQRQLSRLAMEGWPVTVTRVTYREQVSEEHFEPWESAKERVLADCWQQIATDVKNNVQIVEKWCIINNTGSTFTIRAYARVEQEVGNSP